MNKTSKRVVGSLQGIRQTRGGREAQGKVVVGHQSGYKQERCAVDCHRRDLE